MERAGALSDLVSAQLSSELVKATGRVEVLRYDEPKRLGEWRFCARTNLLRDAMLEGVLIERIVDQLPHMVTARPAYIYIW